MDYCFSVNFLTEVIILGYVREFLGFRKCTLKCLEEEREGRSRGRRKEGFPEGMLLSLGCSQPLPPQTSEVREVGTSQLLDEERPS